MLLLNFFNIIASAVPFTLRQQLSRALPSKWYLVDFYNFFQLIKKLKNVKLTLIFLLSPIHA